MALRDLISPGAIWTSTEVLPESLPHLFHWDFTYLWMLEKQVQVRPQSWSDRVEAWRRLLALLLLGRLELRQIPLQPPLLNYAEPLGINSIVVAHTKQPSSSRPIGVLSPVVIIRPMPEENAATLLQSLPDFTRPGTLAPPEFALLQPVLIDAQRKLSASQSKYARRMAEVIAREIPTQAANVAGQVQTNVVSVSMLKDDDRSIYRRRKGLTSEKPKYESVLLQVFAHVGPRRFVPRCTSCPAPLTSTSPVVVPPGAEDVSIPCRNSHFNVIRLDQLLLWRDGNEILAWTDRDGNVPASAGPFPPPPVINGNIVQFTWEPLDVDGDPTNNKLVLQFANATVRTVELRDVLYDRLLVPGSLDVFSGTPVRAQWLRAVRQQPQMVPDHGDIVCRNLHLRGFVAPFDKRYLSNQIVVAPSLQIASFPAPLHTGWKRYRFFLSGASVSQRLGLAEFEAVSSARVLETRNGWPGYLFCEDSQSGAGATWVFDRSISRQPNGVSDLYVGVDFGTSHSVVHFSGSQSDEFRVLEPLSFRRSAAALAGISSREIVASFLPPPENRGVGGDTALIPSAFWNAPDDQVAPIRWTAEVPASHATPTGTPANPEAGFKWDRGPLGEQSKARYRFLDELLFLSLATINAENPSRAINWKIGTAYPLAFSYPQRTDLLRILEKLATEVTAYAGGTTPAQFYSINESYACVKAAGHNNPGTIFLIADLGGGSLDVDLFRVIGAPTGAGTNVEHFQVGSIAVGGEQFLTAASKKLGPGAEASTYWKMRDAVVDGQTSSQFPGETCLTKLAADFLPIAMELIRNMSAAYEKETKEQINLLLAGNGWRLAQLLASPEYSPERARTELKNFTAMLGAAQLTTFEQPIPGLRNSKHLVARGALLNARGEKIAELATSPTGTMLPAGLPFTLRFQQHLVSLSWSQLVGDGTPPIDLRGADPQQLEIAIEANGGPGAPETWQRKLRVAVPKECVPTAFFHQMLVSGLANERLAKGPLQVLLEFTAKHLGEQVAGASHA
jgi:hypothetical protein